MSNTFSIKRFAKYLGYDISNAVNNAGWSVAIIPFAPVIIFAFYQFSLLFSNGLGPHDFSSLKTIVFICALAVAFIAIPVKLYGRLTDRRAGSDYLMIPSSIFEKWLSIVLVCCAVYPVCFFTILFGCDALAGALFPDSYGPSVISNLDAVMSSYSAGFNLMEFCYESACKTILTFVLGSIIFKNGKVAKTVMACLVIGAVFSFLAMAVIGTWHIDMEDFIKMLGKYSEQEAVSLFKFIVHALDLFVNAVLLFALYLRLKTMKH